MPLPSAALTCSAYCGLRHQHQALAGSELLQLVGAARDDLADVGVDAPQRLDAGGALGLVDGHEDMGRDQAVERHAVIDRQRVDLRLGQGDLVLVLAEDLELDLLVADDRAGVVVRFHLGVADDVPGGLHVVRRHLDAVGPLPALAHRDDELLVLLEDLDVLGPLHVVAAVGLLEGAVPDPVAVDRGRTGVHPDDRRFVGAGREHGVQGGDIAEQRFVDGTAALDRWRVILRPGERLYLRGCRGQERCRDDEQQSSLH